MLSEEKVALLKQSIADWGTLNKVPQNIRDMVTEMGMENPRTMDEKQAICQKKLWSDAVIKWYDDFIGYLEAKRREAADKPASETDDFDLVLSLKTVIRLLNQIVDRLEGRDGN